MRVAIFASRGISLPDLNELLPEGVTELIAGESARMERDTEACARTYGIPLRTVPLERDRYGRRARLAQCAQMIDRAELVLALWDGVSRDIPRLLRRCSRPGVPFCVLRADKIAKPR